MNSKNLYPMLINLQLFAEGGAGAGDGGTGAEGTQGVTAAAAMPRTKGEKSNPLADVIYGKQPEQNSVPAAEGQVKPEAQPDRNAEFEKLIKGEFKEQYDAKVQDTMQKRLSKLKGTEEKFNALAPTLELLSQRYGVDVNDIEALSNAIQEDDSYYEQEALEKGITVQQLKDFRRTERENEALKQQMQEIERRENADRIYAQWLSDAENLKQVYPTFDLNTEMQNEAFTRLLGVGIDMRTAYEVTHKDDIIRGAMQFTAQSVEQKITNRMKANGARPIEGGMGSQSAAQVKSDVSQLSDADVAEVIRRVKRGERVSF